MAVLVIAEHDNSELKDATAKAITAARAFQPDVDVLVAGSGAKAVAEAAAKLDGVRKVRLADSEALGHGLPDAMTATIEPLMSGYDAVFAPDTTTHKNYMPRLAARLDVQPISSVTGVEGETFERPIYAGNAVAYVKSSDPKKVVTVRTTAFDKAGEGGSASVEEVEAHDGNGKASFVSEELSESDRPELTSAKIVVSGGRGVGSSENFDLIEGLADTLGAAVGASRAAVDAGYVSNDYQVGQTGKAVAPELYIAIGISGAIQHLAGMKDSKVIVAINKDEDAPIFQVADYGLVGDLFKVVPELKEELAKAA